MSVESTEEPRVLARPDHPISRKSIDEIALKVLYRLHRAGYKAYVVGGAVRDLMLGRRPKDFDISTDARPNQIRRLFRNSRIIGRRFRLAHIYFHDGIVEVATFRRDPDPKAQDGAPGDLLITDDNVFGTPREDAFRRDFTVNALFYSIADYSVIDYVGGVEDLERSTIRAIGDPEVRFQEDPVRMLRACEMAGRLDFAIEEPDQKAIRRLAREMDKAAPARVTEEVVQLLRCGAAAKAMGWMLELGLLEIVLPEAVSMLTAGEQGIEEFERVLPTLDRMVASGRELSDAVLLGALLLPSLLLLRHAWQTEKGRRIHRRAMNKLIDEATEPFFRRFTVARVRREEVRQALATFQSLGERQWSVADRVRFASRASFDDALALFEIMVEATGEGGEELAGWKRVQRKRPPRKVRPKPRRRRRRRRRRRAGTDRKGG